MHFQEVHPKKIIHFSTQAFEHNSFKVAILRPKIIKVLSVMKTWSSDKNKKFMQIFEAEFSDNQ